MLVIAHPDISQSSASDLIIPLLFAMINTMVIISTITIVCVVYSTVQNIAVNISVAVMIVIVSSC